MKLTFLLGLLFPIAAYAAEPIALRWLDGGPPGSPAGVTWGVPWSPGELQKSDPLALKSGDGRQVPVQSWPLAYWPDGSVKWTGHAIAADRDLPNEFAITRGQPAASPQSLMVTDSADAVTIDTGIFRARLPKNGPILVESFTIGDRVVAQSGRLVVLREDRSQRESQRITREEEFVSEVGAVTVERSGPLHAVIKIEGLHRAVASERRWLPFSVRLSFFAGSSAVRLTHSFVFDGDAHQDYLRGLGLRFNVPFRDEPHNRHVRFSGELDGGMWVQPVRMIPGFRSQAGTEITQLYDKHLRGEKVPGLAELQPRGREAVQTMPIWGDAKLTQVSPNGWTILKRTTAEASWLHVTDGRRSRGLVAIADSGGGLALAAKDFWQKAPSSIEVLRAGTPTAEVNYWLWSPDAPAMDLRRYDEIPHGLAINYEDWKPGWGTPLGIANTHDLTLWVLGSMPTHEALVGMSRSAAEPPQLVCTPEYYHAQRAFGYWSLPDRSTPTLTWIEDQVTRFVDYYQRQVDERSWYGFWDFGDIMHNYDFGRHEWRYDIGGWAWVNTELMPDMLLWYSFLRTGRADWYRFAEAMTRHTSEVDVHHLGPFAPLGSRHNVNHWGDGAKQPRASHAGLKRTYYFLSGGDGRIGDLLREQIDADLTYAYLAQFNPSHYVPNPDGTPRLDVRGGPGGQRARVPEAPRPEDFAARPNADDRKPNTRFGLEWMCYALNWTTEWERGGDQSWRARIESDMRSMASQLDEQGRFPGRYFDMIFGGPENMWEMEPMYDIPEFWRAWVNTCEAVGRTVEGNHMTGPRMLGYAAFKKGDAELGLLAWQKLLGPPGQLPATMNPTVVDDSSVVRRMTEPDFLGESVGWQQHGVASVQWALNAIETLEFAKAYLPLWEKALGPNAAPGSK